MLNGINTIALQFDIYNYEYEVFTNETSGQDYA